MLVEIAAVLLLIVLNGVLAMSELAIVQSRPARLGVLAENGRRGARIARDLAQDPGRFLSTVQIGITLVGILAGAISGATLGDRLGDALAAGGMPAGAARTIGVGLVVVSITYLSLIIGELVPKQIALRAPEKVAAAVAPMMLWLSRAMLPVVWFLDHSGRLLLRLLGQSGRPEQGVSEQEVHLIMDEAESAGVIELAERRMIAGVMRVADRTARGLMTSRREAELIDAATPLDAVLARLRTSERSRFPVFEKSQDDILGIVYARDIFAVALATGQADVRDLVREAPIVMDGLDALEVIERLRTSESHMVLVYDEYGTFQGLITPMDVLSAIAGEFEGEDDPKVVRRADGSLLVAGWMPIDEFADLLSVGVERRSYATVAGLVLDAAGHIPRVGDVVEVAGLRIEVVDMDGQRVDKLLVTRPGPAVSRRPGSGP